MIDILEIGNGIWVLEENGQNVLLKDCQRYGLSRGERKELFNTLQMVAIILEARGSLDPLIKGGLLKRLTRQPEVLKESLWEVRSDARWGRIIFVMRDPRSIIVSAVNKGKGSLREAIQRGLNRWKRFLKEEGK